MKLTTTRSNDSKKTGYELYVDGEYMFSVDQEDYIRLHLYDKCEISDEELDEIKTKVEVSRGISCALKYTIRQKRTGKQVEDCLLKNDISPKAIEQVLQYLAQQKYIDDPDYAKRYMRSRIKTTDKSLNLIVTELQQRGIPEELTENLIPKYADMEFDRAYAAVLKRYGSFKMANPLTNREDTGSSEDPFGLTKMTVTERLKLKKKVYQFLMYRGYKQDTITDIINKTGI